MTHKQKKHLELRFVFITLYNNQEVKHSSMLRTIYEHYTHTFYENSLKKKEKQSQHRTYNIFLYKQIKVLSHLFLMLFFFPKKEFNIKSQTFLQCRCYMHSVYIYQYILAPLTVFPNSTSFPFLKTKLAQKISLCYKS